MKYETEPSSRPVRHRYRPSGDFLATPMTAPATVVEAFRRMENERQAKVVCVFLNRLLEVLDCELVGIGDGRRSLIDVPSIIGRSLASSADAVIVVLNHPASSATPSRQERAAHSRLLSLAGELRLNVLDMVIVSKLDWFSFSDERYRIEA